MDRIRTRFFVAVSSRLAAAADTDMKADLVEELSDNLYQRYLDLTSQGMDSEAAYGQALEDLGDVDELLSYLESADPDTASPKKDRSKEFTENLARNVEEIVRETVSQAKDAAVGAKNIAVDLASRLKVKPPKGSDHSIHVNCSGDKGQGSDKNWTWSFGYDKNRGGFYATCSDNGPQVEREFPAQEIWQVEVALHGDLKLQLGESDSILVSTSEKEMAHLEMKAEGGVFSLSCLPKDCGGVREADVILTLPRKLWTKLDVTTYGGDISLGEGLAAGEFFLQSNGGDVVSEGYAGKLELESNGGDVCLRGLTGDSELRTAGGDISVAGAPEHLCCQSAGGDAKFHLAELPQSLNVKSAGGDVKLFLPQDQGFVLKCKVFGGDFASELPLSHTDGGDLIYLDGGSSSFSVDSVGGDVSIKKV